MTKIMTWNISGLNRLYNLHTDEEALIAESKIIGLTETWNQSEVILPNFLKKYDIIQSKAKREHKKGRAAGGLALLIEKNWFSKTTIIATTTEFIIVELQ